MSLTVSELAEKAGVQTDTVRFYEKKGLLPLPPRSASGYRKYPDETVSTIRFIRRTKDLGFTLDEIGGLIALSSDSKHACKKVQQKASEKLTDVKQRIKDLKKMERALNKLITDCEEEGKVSGCCPLLKALGG